VTRPDVRTLTTLTDMTSSPISPALDELWERRAELTPDDGDARRLVVEAVDLLDTGQARVAQIVGDEVVVDERAKRAILLSFKVLPMRESAAGEFHHHDRVPLKTTFEGVRVVPGAIARWGSYFEPGVVLMPSYTNIGGYVGAGSMVDTWATVGSCAQIGKNVHLSGGVGIGGVLEPPNAAPVVIEDGALIGSRSMIVEGARVGKGAVVGAGVILSPSIPVIDVETGEEISRGRIPDWCVAVGGTRPREFAGGTFGLPCVLVIKRLVEGERHDKAQLNDVLRGHGLAT
jgi:2,3,4,5-tetrahydropyridine-2-carboxylate N-succinyltransferase